MLDFKKSTLFIFDRKIRKKSKFSLIRSLATLYGTAVRVLSLAPISVAATTSASESHPKILVTFIINFNK